MLEIEHVIDLADNVEKALECGDLCSAAGTISSFLRDHTDWEFLFESAESDMPKISVRITDPGLGRDDFNDLAIQCRQAVYCDQEQRRSIGIALLHNLMKYTCRYWSTYGDSPVTDPNVPKELAYRMRFAMELLGGRAWIGQLEYHHQTGFSHQGRL